MSSPFLLAPVRDETSFTAALQAGADAVYFGVGELNMRISSRGIDLSDLPRIVAGVHEQGVKVLVTLNVIVYDHELNKLEDILTKIKKAKVDAVICWDLAVIQKCQELQIPFHISTQASISNAEAARFYEKLGAQCIVLARECTLEQICEIKKNISCQVEVFCHGAMCISVSGRCFLSQFLECKSANRGECVQPCRRAYRIIDREEGHELEVSNGFVMSSKDLCTLRILDKLIDTGIDVLKIEGRGRSPEYIYTVTKAYRAAIDLIAKDNYTSAKQDELIAEVNKVYHRGFSTGFLMGRPTEEGWARGSDSQATEHKEYIGKVTNYFKKTQICEVALHSGELQVSDKIQIQGPSTGVYRLKIAEIKTHPEGELTFPCQETVRKQDEVYKIER